MRTFDCFDRHAASTAPSTPSSLDDNATASKSSSISSSALILMISANSISLIFLARSSNGFPCSRLSNISYDASSSCVHFSRYSFARASSSFGDFWDC